MPRPAVVITGALALVLVGTGLWFGLRTKPPEPDRLVLERVDFASLPGWTAGRQAGALEAFKRSCARLEELSGERSLGAGGIAGAGADWRRPCAAAGQRPAGNDAVARAFFETWFTPLAARNNDRWEGLFTGYFEPELRGSLSQGGPYRVPLYARPPDLVTVDLGRFRDHLEGRQIAGRVVDGHLRPFETRAEIDRGALAGKARVLAWVDDPVAAFFLHVQGSGRVVLDDGRVLRVGYAGQNGHVYVPIGAELVRLGALEPEEVSLQTIRAWLEQNPDKAAAVMAKNPSFIFFREGEGEEPIGAEGVPLTPGRSLAVDRRYIPLGVPVWLDVMAPAADPAQPDRRLRRLMVAQDGGGAIRGPVRGDIFWGRGREAEAVAGRMRHRGRYILLLPRAFVEAAPPVS